MANLVTTRLNESGDIVGEHLVCHEPVCGLTEPLDITVLRSPALASGEAACTRSMVGCTQCQTLQMIAAIEC